MRIPFRSVENAEWKRLALMQNPQYPLPSATTIRNCLITQLEQVEATFLQDIVPRAKVSLSLDCWSSSTRLSFMAVMAHFINKDWQLCEKLIGFENLTDVHSGAELARVVNGIVMKYRLQSRVISITTDNASNNSSLVLELNSMINTALKKKLVVFDNEIQHIPCLSHVIQLALQALLGKIRIRPKNEVFLRDWEEVQQLSDLDQIATTENRGVPYTLAKVSITIIIVIFMVII